MSVSVSIREIKSVKISSNAIYERVSYTINQEGTAQGKPVYRWNGTYEGDTYVSQTRDFIIETGIPAGSKNIEVSGYHFGYNRIGYGGAWSILPDYQNKPANDENIQYLLNNSADPSQIRIRVVTDTFATINLTGTTMNPDYVPDLFKSFDSGIDYEIFSFEIIFDEGDESTVSFGVDGAWNPCHVYYGVENIWKPCKAYFGTGGVWKPVK